MVRGLVIALSGVACLGLAACGRDINPVRDAFALTGIGAEPKPAPDFITQSRPETLEYRPTGAAPPPRALTSKMPDDVKKSEAEMDALKASNETRASTARKAGSSVAPVAPNTKASAPVN